MKPNWQPLDKELDHWRDAGMTLPLWWRDDDAVTAGPALDRLFALADKHALKVHLAIIPNRAQTPLKKRLAQTDRAIPLVHGWRHANHSAPPDKKCEFAPDRDLETRLNEARQAFARLCDFLAAAPAPVFVPPWNRIGSDMHQPMGEMAYCAISTFGDRQKRYPAPGLEQVNTHLDPIHWRGGRSLLPPDTLIEGLADGLKRRRTGEADNTEPFGILTHHLVHDAAIWDFTDALLSRLLSAPVALWEATQLTPKGATDESA